MLTDFVPFFRDRIPKADKNQSNLVQFEVKQNWSIQDYDSQDNNTSFICSNCLCFRQAYCGYLRNYKRQRQQSSIAKKIQPQEKICAICIYNQLPHEHRSAHLIQSQYHQFFTQIKEFQELKLICLIKNSSPTIKIQFFQMTHMNKNRISLVPVFWSVLNERKKIIFKITPQQIKLNYYMFSLRDDVLIISVNRLALLEQLRQSQKVNLNQQKLQPHLCNRQGSFSFYSVPNQKQGLHVPILDLKFNQTILEECESERVIILYRPEVQFLILMSDVTSPEQIERYVNKKDILKEVEYLKKQIKWDLYDRYIDNQSLEAFKEVNLLVTMINFKTNKLAEIPKLLANQLRELNLQNNKIQNFTISINTFPKLVVMKLSNNKIRNIGPVHHINLQQLDLSHNYIVSLQESEWFVKNLSNLNVSSNQIVNINLLYFANCHTLCFYQNPFEIIEFPPIFPNLQKLHLVDLSKVQVDLSEIQSPKMKSFQVNHCELSKLPLPNSLLSLQVMYITDCSIDFLSLNKDFPRLRKFQIRACHNINQINTDWFPKTMQTLGSISISAMNSLRSVNLSDVCFPSLSQFEIGGCRVLQKVLLPVELPQLACLDISDTATTFINFPQNLSELKVLRINNNKLKQLDFSNLQCGSLSIIHCEHNELEQITFSPSMASICTIWAFHNKLRQLDFTVLPLSRIDQIRCGYNQIERLRFAEDSVFPLLKILQINNNPLRLPEGCNIAINKTNMPKLDRFKSDFYDVLETTIWIIALLSETEYSQLQLKARNQPGLIEFMGRYKSLTHMESEQKETQEKCLQLLKLVNQIHRVKSKFGKDIQNMIQRQKNQENQSEVRVKVMYE